MSFGNAIAESCARQAIKTIVILSALGVMAGAAVERMLKSLGRSAYSITQDDIEMLKDAAAAIGPGDPIARELWRLAERAEGK